MTDADHSFDRSYQTYDQHDHPFVLRARDDGRAIGIRDHLVELDADSGRKVWKVAEAVEGVGKLTVRRICDHHEWFEPVPIGGTDGVRLTDAGRASYEEDPNAGEADSEVVARAD